jgi:hypothetical protein
VLLRGLLALRAQPRPVHLAEVVRAVEAAHGVSLPSIARLERWRCGQETLRQTDLDATAIDLHDELAVLAARVERR